MSLIPSVIVQSVLEDLNRAARPLRQLHDQNFGLGLLNDDLHFDSPSFLTPFRSGYIRSARPQHQEINNSGISDVINDGKNFKVSLSVPQFKPEEVIVKLVDNYLVIEGKHEERQDEHGIVSRQFVRRYKLPKNVITETISSTISSDGVLSITANKAIAAGNERRIPVVPTYQLAVRREDTQVANKNIDQANHE